MSEKLPFEENMNEQFNKLQLPDEEQSWQKMKVLLDEEDNNRRPLLFWFHFLLVAILLAGLSTGAYFLFFRDDTSLPAKNSAPINDISSSHKSNQSSKQHSGNKGLTTPHNTGSQTTRTLDNKKTENISQSEENKIVSGKLQSLKKETIFKTQEKLESTPGKRNEESIRNNNQINAHASVNEGVETNDVKPDKDVELSREEKSSENITVQSGNTISESLQENKRKIRSKDSTKKARLRPEVDSVKDAGAEVKYFFSAGIGIQQQIPVGGQGSVPYNVYGREASISDYIPSVFFRFHQEDKWFIMAEFRYGAPQQVKDFNYSQKSFYDTSSMILSTTTMRLRKTYYHQLPVSFNFYVKPDWSVGLGAMYSRFYGAVSEKEIRKENVFTQDVSYTKSISNMKGFTDSFLHKTQVHLVLNTDYQWKNFLLGLRFTKDIQPYIKYTSPDGVINKERNYSLQVIFRWQLWRNE